MTLLLLSAIAILVLVFAILVVGDWSLFVFMFVFVRAGVVLPDRCGATAYESATNAKRQTATQPVDDMIAGKKTPKEGGGSGEGGRQAL